MIAIMLKAFSHYLALLPSRLSEFMPNETVLKIEDPVTGLFVVESGLVHLLRFQEDGGRVVLQRAQRGAILAEASVFTTHYHCDAVCMLRTSLRRYSVNAVQKLLSQNAEAAQSYALHLADEVRVARRRAEILALKTVSERLSAWLIWHGGILPAKGQWHHIAEDIGVSREALYRELSRRG